jgi:hypothetical protein
MQKSVKRAIPLLFSALATVAYACAAGSDAPDTGTAGPGGSGPGSGGSGGASTGGLASSTASVFAGSGGSGHDGGFDPDAACATATETAKIEKLPVDIIWMVDNSASMQPAIDQVTAGLNDFAALIASKNLDYKVIMLSLRSKTNPVTINGSTRYGVCIPSPLAGDNDCGNGTRFFQSSIDMKSTQPLEQFLGTLGQTSGFQPGDDRGGDPWMQELRTEATKTIVVVTDDNARFSATEFQSFPGGANPFNSTTLPPGILHPSWSGLFDGFIFSGIYGWGSDVDPSLKCQFPDATAPASSGPTYTTLVSMTGGVRAKICDGAPAWGPFFDSVAQAVEETAKLTCELAIPVPDRGTLDPEKINVSIVGNTTTTALYKVGGPSDCDANGGWYYDDDANPTRVILCPASCDVAQQAASEDQGRIDVIFGCETVTKPPA